MDKYWVNNGGAWTDATNHWATSSGGTPDVGNLPTFSDNVFFDANSFSTTGQIVTIPSIYPVISQKASCNDMDWTETAYPVTITHASSSNGCRLSIYGSIILVPGLTFSDSMFLRFRLLDNGTDTTIDCNGSALPILDIYKEDTAITLQGDFLGIEQFYLYSGTLNANNYNFTMTEGATVSFESGTTVNMGNGTWYVYTLNLVSGATVNCDLSTLQVYNIYNGITNLILNVVELMGSGSFSQNGFTANTLQESITGSDTRIFGKGETYTFKKLQY